MKFNSGMLKSDLIFGLLFILIATFYYYSFINKGPLNAHLWRQTDCLSLTSNYAEGAGFFHPEMHIQLGDDNTTGKTAGEFPLLYYLVGMFWKIFGKNYLVYRLFYLLILFAGTFAFYKSLKILFGDAFWAVTIALLLFTSPVYVYYGISFLTDVPAISFVLIALYFILQYRRKNRLVLLYSAMFFFALAGLIKISSMIAFVFLFLIFLLELFPVKSLGDQKLFTHPKHELPGFLLVFLVIFSWYAYAHYYNNLHGFKYTFNSIFPLWILQGKEIKVLFENVRNFTSLVFFSRAILYVLLVLWIITFFLRKKIPLLAFLANILIMAGSVIYFILWAPLMGNHDYYFAALLILFPGIVIPFIWFLKSHHQALFHDKRIKIFLVFFLLYNFLYCYNIIELKTFAEKGRFILTGNTNFVGLMKWTNADVREHWMPFAELKPALNQLGIKKEDRIISLPDKSFNISLFLLDRKGWTDYLNYNKTGDIENLIDKGAKFLFISDTALLKQEFLLPFLSDSIGSYKHIRIYRLPQSGKEQ